MEAITALAIGIVILCMLGKVISMPMHLLWKLITNSIAGSIMLWAVNLFGAGIKITFMKALIAGVLGIPGVVLVWVLDYLNRGMVNL